MNTDIKTLDRPELPPADVMPARTAQTVRCGEEDAVLVIDLGNPVALDVAELWSRNSDTTSWFVCSDRPSPTTTGHCASSLLKKGSDPLETANKTEKTSWPERVRPLFQRSGTVEELRAAAHNIRRAVVFTKHPFSSPEDPDIRRVAEQLRTLAVERLCFVTGCSVHFEDAGAAALETFLSTQFADTQTELTILRTCFVLSPRSSVTKWSRRLSWVSGLLSASPRCGFVSLSELSECVRHQLFSCAGGRQAKVTMLGRNRPWRDVLRQLAPPTILTQLLTTVAIVLRFAGAGLLLRAVLKCLLSLDPQRRVYDFDMIRPQSEEELLSLCHKHNYHHVSVCGYNNGVSHFGWKHHGRTVIPTTQTGTVIEVDHDHVLVDAGMTLKRCVDVLNAAGRQFYVMPNYSYIGMGTIFFVPVHGSGSDVSTLGDTIQWVRWFDPRTGQFQEAARGETLFDHMIYNRNSNVVLLQLILTVRETTDYFVETSAVVAPAAADIQAVFQDEEASNIEIRKSRAASDSILISRYFTCRENEDSRLSVPRDGIGQLWDRLEENRVTAFLFHWMVRTFAYHVELFLREDEFEVFWKHHQQLPVSKIQLRFVRRDGMPHSPFGQSDCVSADLFMWRYRRCEFQSFIRTHLPEARMNPGKQSL